MSDWPKEIVVRGIAIHVNSWDELDEVIKRYGASEIPGARVTAVGTVIPSGGGTGQLTHSDRTMLQQFLSKTGRILLNSELSAPLGAEGKGIKPKLDEWSRRIGLTNSEGDAFEAVNMGRAGRGYRLTEMAAAVARSLLGQEGGVS